ncbi:histidinol dehydrogenase [Stygiolobus caldivivus]|uniref:Histidinol dehydrogenase n=1 Tax=Stygiolobus caldivivus TaxID=2824673 RepID=A0A8D5U9J0_9CREN|nr:histidinol dehydrogenase [Stygiolobus caldivivus]BCU71363.1 histidinol dehydrogenase [Stygiolobus caldivivus]
MISFELPKSRPNDFTRVLPVVEEVIKGVREKGDIALLELEEKFDHVKLDSVVEDKVDELAEKIPPDLREAIDYIYDQLTEFHESIKPYNAGGNSKGVEFGVLWKPVEKVGIYVPGGNKAYPSTLLMAGIPAKVAGVSEIYAATPPSKIDPAICYISKKLRIKKLYRLGGAQAIAAFAYGTESVIRVDKIVGPGNIYVQAAKFLVSKEIGIDGIEGPTELVIIADENADAKEIVLDMKAQAEHGTSTFIVLLSTSQSLIDQVVPQLKDDNIIYYIIKVSTIEEAIKVLNEISPEHLSLYVANPKKYLDKIANSGAISLGATPPAIIDYAAGPNHILPTNRWARFKGGVTVYDFLKPVMYAYTEKPDEKLIRSAMVLARHEGFEFHAKSIGVRYGRE